MSALKSFERSVAATALSNVAGTAAAGIAGLVIARSLGPSTRGEYAAIVAWFGVALIIGHLGQNGATTYFVAREPVSARDYLTTTRCISVASGGVVVLVGLIAAPLLAGRSDAVLSGYRLMFLTCLVDFAASAFIFALQSSNIKYWNLVRIARHCLFLLGVLALHATGHLTLTTALGMASLALVIQAAISWRLCHLLELTGGRARLQLARPLGRYGLGQLAATAPYDIIARLDLLVLSLVVAPSAVGHYAVASSLTMLALPFVSAVGNVAFPRIAAQSLGVAEAKVLERRTVVLGAAVSAAVLLPLGCLAPWIVPFVFGADYRDAVGLVLLLVPGGAFLACGQVCADVLRGRDQLLIVARAQLIGAGTMIILMSISVPAFGVTGAAIASSCAAGLVLALKLSAVLRPRAKVDGSRDLVTVELDHPRKHEAVSKP